MNRTRWYLAHPVGAPTREGQLANVAAAKECCRAILAANLPGVTLVAPWLLRAELTFDDQPGMRERALEEAMVELDRCDGIVLSGPVVSTGMRLELRRIVAQEKRYVNWTRPGSDFAGLPFMMLEELSKRRPPLREDRWFTYQTWIEGWVSCNVVRGACRAACLSMQTTYPELDLVPGVVRLFDDTPVEHWWLVDAFGSVVDPTACQFEGRRIIEYRPWSPGDMVRVGTCMNCGGALYDRPRTLSDVLGIPSACSDECERALDSAYNGPA